MISTDITSAMLDRTSDRARATSAAVCTVASKSAGQRITAELRASSFAGGHVWLRPAVLDVHIPTTPGHLVQRPPT